MAFLRLPLFLLHIRPFADGVRRRAPASPVPLPPHTYRVIESGGFAGSSYTLEVPRHFFPGKRYVHLTGDGFCLLSREQALEQARAEIAHRFGAEAAQAAQFPITWDGSL
jgi:hypothetical protein